MQLTFGNISTEVNIVNLVKKPKSHEDGLLDVFVIVVWWRNMWMTSWGTTLTHTMRVWMRLIPSLNHLEFFHGSIQA